MDLSSIFKSGWEWTKRHWLPIMFLLIVIYALSAFVFYKIFPAEFWDLYKSVITSGDMTKVAKLQPYIEENAVRIWVLNLIQYALFFGVLNAALSVFIGETKTLEFKYLSLPLGTYLNLAQYICIMLILAQLSIYALGIPLIYFGIRLLFVVPLVLQFPRISFYTAVFHSWQMTKGRFFNLLLFCIICFLLLVAGVFCCFVGVFFTSVICIFSYFILYEELRLGKSSPNS